MNEGSLAANVERGLRTVRGHARLYRMRVVLFLRASPVTQQAGVPTDGRDAVG